MKRKLLSLVLALAMCLGLCGTAFATWKTNAESSSNPKEYLALEAGETEVKSSTGYLFKLSNPVLGSEIDAQNYSDEHPFYLIPLGTTLTVLNPDGSICEDVYCEEIDSGGNTVGFPYTFNEEAPSFHFDIFEEFPYTELWLRVVKADEAPAPKPNEPPVTPAPAANPFTDVKESDYFYAPVLWAVEKGITNGTTDTTFSPNSTCTVTEILTFLWRAAGSPEPTIENPYQNVSMDSWFGPAVIWAYEKEMGVTEDLLTADCTRASTAVYLWKAAGSPEAEKAAEFTDVAADANYAAAVAWAVEKGVTTGTSDTTFSPEDVCTRGQIATFLYRAFADGDQQ